MTIIGCDIYAAVFHDVAFARMARDCDAELSAISIGAGLVIAIIGSIVAAMRRRWWPLVGSAIAAAVLIGSPLALGSALSKECADEPPSMTAEEFSRYLEKRPECAHY